jgi:hypothetical protein
MRSTCLSIGSRLCDVYVCVVRVYSGLKKSVTAVAAAAAAAVTVGSCCGYTTEPVYTALCTTIMCIHYYYWPYCDSSTALNIHAGSSTMNAAASMAALVIVKKRVGESWRERD